LHGGRRVVTARPTFVDTSSPLWLLAGRRFSQRRETFDVLHQREHIPPAGALREQRERRRVHRAAEAARGDGATAMAVALAHIGAAFDEAAAIHGFKLRVERFIALGPDHAAVQARYGARAAMLAGCDLDAAIARAERWWRNERKAYQIASVFGGRPRLSLEVLSELRLVLRLMRLKQMDAEFESMRGGVAHDFVSSAAAE
jgi:hypothetical protein